MAKECIERKALLDDINSAPVSMSICMNVDECKGRIYERERLVRIINEATAADVVSRDCYDRLLAENDELRKERPVRHGRWVWNPDGMDWGLGAWCCSECKSKAETWWANDQKYNPLHCSGGHFCGNCGARMDGDGE